LFSTVKKNDPCKQGFIRDIFMQGCKGYTPLHLAVASEFNGDIVRMLLRFGANINAINQGGETPLHLAVAYEFNDDIVRMLLRFGANINAQDNNGNTPLHIAASRGHIGVVQVLVEAGANKEARDNIWEGHHVIEHGLQV
jgi:ankyrin repeat protein